MKFSPAFFSLSLAIAGFVFLPDLLSDRLAIAQSTKSNTTNRESDNAEITYKTELKRLVDEGDIQLKKNNFKAAISIYKRALDTTKQNRDLEDQGMILWGLGRVYNEDGQFLLAESSFIDGLKIIEQSAKMAKNSPNQMRTRIYLYTGLGITYQNIGEYDKSVDYLKQAVNLSANTPLLPQFLILTHFEPKFQLAQIYHKLQKYQQAIDLLRECQNLALQMNDRQKEALTLTAIGNSHGAMGNVKLAKAFYDQAKKLGDFPQEPQISNRRDQTDQALEVFSDLSGFFEKLIPTLTKTSIAIRKLSRATISDSRFVSTGKLADTLDRMTNNLQSILIDLKEGNWLKAIQNMNTLQNDRNEFSRSANELISLVNSIKQNPEQYRNLNQLSQEAMDMMKEIIRDVGGIKPSLGNRSKSLDKQFKKSQLHDYPNTEIIYLKKNNLRTNLP
jgi:tetratricopeptide (TPR) repeat protein